MPEKQSNAKIKHSYFTLNTYNNIPNPMPKKQTLTRTENKTTPIKILSVTILIWNLQTIETTTNPATEHLMQQLTLITHQYQCHSIGVTSSLMIVTNRIVWSTCNIRYLNKKKWFFFVKYHVIVDFFWVKSKDIIPLELQLVKHY